MRLKTLGVLLVTALAAFTMLYWFTDTMRRDQVAKQQEEELAEFGEVIFSNDPTQPAAAACARCHGSEGEGGPIPNDPDGRQAPSLHTASLANKLRDSEKKLSDTIESGIGNLVDADLAKESAKLQALQVKQQLGVQALSIANQAPQTITRLFQ